MKDLEFYIPAKAGQKEITSCFKIIPNSKDSHSPSLLNEIKLLILKWLNNLNLQRTLVFTSHHQILSSRITSGVSYPE